MTASGMWSSSPGGAIAVRPTAVPLPWQAPAFRRPVAARSPVGSVPAATFPSGDLAGHRSPPAVASSPATTALASGAGLLPATGAAASGRPRAVDRLNGRRPGLEPGPITIGIDCLRQTATADGPPLFAGAAIYIQRGARTITT